MRLVGWRKEELMEFMGRFLYLKFFYDNANYPLIRTPPALKFMSHLYSSSTYPQSFPLRNIRLSMHLPLHRSYNVSSAECWPTHIPSHASVEHGEGWALEPKEHVKVYYVGGEKTPSTSSIQAGQSSLLCVMSM